MLHFYENIVHDEVGYATAVQRVSRTRSSILDVMTKLGFILDELFLANFERDKRLEETSERMDNRTKILILKGLGSSISEVIISRIFIN